MLAEWFLIASMLGIMLFLIRKHCRAFFVWGCIAIGATTAGAVFWQGHIKRSVDSLESLKAQIPRQIKHDNYVGSESCRSCHPSQYESWHRSYHRTMTQLATPQAVRGDFEKVRLEWRGETFFLERRGDEFWVDMIDPDWRFVQATEEYQYQVGKRARPPRPEPNPPRAKKRIGLVTGSHHMQAYWVPGKYGNQQFNFPFTYLLEDRRWAPRDDVFLKDPHAGKSFQTWNVNCFACHSTAGQPKQDPNTYIMNSQVAEFGISCEACHGPAEEHVRKNAAPLRRYALHHGKQGDQTIVNPARLDAKKASEVCSQCHATRNNIREDWRMNGSRFHPGQDGILEVDAPLVRPDNNSGRTETLLVSTNSHSILRGSFWGDGMIRVSGREFNGLAYTPCFQKGDLSCLSCHSMHQSVQSDDQLGRGMEGNQACVQCHSSFKSNLTAHTRHGTESTGSRCYNCHMPHTTYGLLKAIRSHQISSPSVKSSVETGRPNACNLCHLDKPLNWTADYLETWFRQPKPQLTEDDKRISAAAKWVLQGDAGQRAIVAWHMGWEPAKQISGTNWLGPYLGQLLEDPYAAVRYVAQRSLKRLPGFSDFSYDFSGPAEERNRAHARVLSLWKDQAPAVRKDAVLIEAKGDINRSTYERLLKERDDQTMDLLE
jgi:predicted CXXCH cytochrome family protein